MFRVVIGCMKEISLLKLVTTPDGMVRNVETEEALELEKKLITLPKLTTTLLRYNRSDILINTPRWHCKEQPILIRCPFYYACWVKCMGMLLFKNNLFGILRDLDFDRLKRVPNCHQ